MQTLDRTLRRELERTIHHAREVAENAAHAMLQQLSVGTARPEAYLEESQRALRRRLRAHGRQLGDTHVSDDTQELTRLLEEVAYQHWHRMLFARFLAENDLLMYPDPRHPIPITLEECEELAADEGLRNAWEVAARYATKMLPQIFRPDSPVFELRLPLEYQLELEDLLTHLPTPIFTAQDSLGWVYQFWQAKRKDQVNASEVKIGARELSAVTQLFTEPYMVSFLLDNTLGAWWATQRLSEADWHNAQSEAELRQKAALEGVPLTYLRCVRHPDTHRWMPANHDWRGFPSDLASLKVLDPCCGSGHFLVALLLMLTPLRQQAEQLTPQQALDAVLRDNLHGLELDQRCVEIAAFALALEAWRYPNAGGYRPLPELQLACTGLDIKATRAEWKAYNISGKKNLSFGMNHLYELFKDAPTLGSLINPVRMDSLIVSWRELHTVFEQAMQAEQDQEQREVGVAAQGMTKAAQLLTLQYHWVVTNVPYLARGKQNEVLREFIERYHEEGKADLATAFLERCLDFCVMGGVVSVVLPQNWLFLGSYKAFRKKLLSQHRWHLIARLGEHGFNSAAAAGAFTILITMSRGEGVVDEALFATSSTPLLYGVDVSAPRNAEDKAQHLLTAPMQGVPQSAQLKNPDARVVIENLESENLLSEYSRSHHGLVCGDRSSMCLEFWEINSKDNLWIEYCGTVASSRLYGGKSTYLRWNNGIGRIKELKGASNLETDAWDSKGIVISAMRKLPVTIYTGMSFDNNTAVLIPKKPEYLPAIWCFCSSPDYHEAVRKIDQKLNVTNATLVKVPFDLERWQQEAEKRYPHGLPLPYSDDPTQWVFHGHPCGSVVWSEVEKRLVHGQPRTDRTVLQVAVARLLGYCFPAELDPTLELSAESRYWVEQAIKLAPLADQDGIVCIPSVNGERPASERLLSLIVQAYQDANGGEWQPRWLDQILASVDASDKTLEGWLRDKFFSQHCALFGQRPFIWHIWDGLRDGFSVLVNYHLFSSKGLESLLYTYLGDWINQQKQAQAHGTEGAQEKLAAAMQLKKRLELIRAGEAPHDIFVRWKSLEAQPLGWQPDLNDGVRMNIRPFMSVADVGKKGAGILRDKPNLDWKKDRGSDVESAPWYHLGKKYGGKLGDRINEHHLTLEEKQDARTRKG